MADGKHGQPTLYRSEYDKQAYKLCLLGATDEELADFFEVCVATIYNWKNEHVSFLESTKRGKVQADSEVANRLFKRAKGYEHDSEELITVSMGSGAGSEVQRHQVRKIYPPDTTAAIFWLKNRQPAKWRDKHEIDTNANINLIVPEIKVYDAGVPLANNENDIADNV